MDEYLKEQVVADMLGCSVSTLQKARVAGGGIPFVKVGARAVRYRRSMVEAYLAGLPDNQSTAAVTVREQPSTSDAALCACRLLVEAYKANEGRSNDELLHDIGYALVAAKRALG